MIFNQLGSWFNARAQGHADLALQCGSLLLWGPQVLRQSFWEDQVVCTLTTYHLPALGCGLVIEKPLEGQEVYG